MFDRFFRRKAVTKKTAPDGTVTEQTTEETAGDPAAAAAAGAEAEKLFTAADNLFAHADEFFAAMGHVPSRPFSRAKAAKPKEEKPAPAPDFMCACPGSAEIAVLGTLHVFRYKGRYYTHLSRDATKPVGYHALDTMRPGEGQP